MQLDQVKAKEQEDCLNGLFKINSTMEKWFN